MKKEFGLIFCSVGILSLLVSSCGKRQTYSEKATCMNEGIINRTGSLDRASSLASFEINHIAKECDMSDEEKESYLSRLNGSEGHASNSNDVYGTSWAFVQGGLKEDGHCRLRYVEATPQQGLEEGVYLFSGTHLAHPGAHEDVDAVSDFVKEVSETQLCEVVAEPCEIVFRSQRESCPVRFGYQLRINQNDLGGRGVASPKELAQKLEQLIEDGVCRLKEQKACRIFYRKAGEVDPYGGYFVERNGRVVHHSGFAYLQGAKNYLEKLRSYRVCPGGDSI